MVKKDFLHIKPDLSEIPRFRLFTGIVFWVFYSITIYFFLVVFRESIRLLSITPDNDVWILSNEEESFYNFFFAFLAVHFSQSIVLVYWFKTPKQFLKKSVFRKQRILNNQTFLNLPFISWFIKLGFLYGLFFGNVLQKGYYHINLYPNILSILLLLIPVLIMQGFLELNNRFKFIGKA